MKKRISEIPYLSIFKNAFVLTWKNRYLWWFGFFVMLSNFGSINWMRDNKNDQLSQSTLYSSIHHASPWLLFAIAIMFTLLIIILILGLISRGALIASIEKHHKNIPDNFKTSFAVGKKYFWRLFFINLFSGLFVLIAATILFPPVAFLFWNHNYLLGAIMAIFAAVIFIPLIVIVAYLRIFGYLYAILGKLKPWAAIDSAYSLFKRNIKSSLLMAVFFIAINIFLFILIVLTMLPLAIVFIPIGLILLLIAGHIGVLIIGAIALLIFGIIIFFLRSILEVFFQTAWILFFHEIASPEEKETVVVSVPEIEPSAKPLPTINTEGE